MRNVERRMPAGVWRLALNYALSRGSNSRPIPEAGLALYTGGLYVIYINAAGELIRYGWNERVSGEQYFVQARSTNADRSAVLYRIRERDELQE